jgi:hypothetical protein
VHDHVECNHEYEKACEDVISRCGVKLGQSLLQVSQDEEDINSYGVDDLAYYF